MLGGLVALLKSRGRCASRIVHQHSPEHTHIWTWQLTALSGKEGQLSSAQKHCFLVCSFALTDRPAATSDSALRWPPCPQALLMHVRLRSSGGLAIWTVGTRCYHSPTC